MQGTHRLSCHGDPSQEHGGPFFSCHQPCWGAKQDGVGTLGTFGRAPWGTPHDDANLPLRPWERESWRWACSWLPLHGTPALPSPQPFNLCSVGAPSAWQRCLPQSRSPGAQHRSPLSFRQQQKRAQRSLGFGLEGSEKLHVRRTCCKHPHQPWGFPSLPHIASKQRSVSGEGWSQVTPPTHTHTHKSGLELNFLEHLLPFYESVAWF